MATKFRKDNAMAFLLRNNAKPVSLLHPLLDSSVGGASSSSNHQSASQGGLKVGKILLARASDASAHAALSTYLLDLVATHIVSNLPLTHSFIDQILSLSGNTTDGAIVDSTTRPAHCKVKWIVSPGDLPFQLLAFVRRLEKAIMVSLARCLMVAEGQVVQELSKRSNGRNSSFPKVVLRSLSLLCLSCLEVAHPPDVGGLVHSISTCSFTSDQSSSAPFSLLSSSTPKDGSAVPLLVVTGLGYRDSILQSFEKQVGCEVPLRWALERFVQTQHASVIFSEAMKFRQNSSSVPEDCSLPPSAPFDLRKDCFLVQNLTSRGSFLSSGTNWADRHSSTQLKGKEKEAHEQIKLAAAVEKMSRIIDREWIAEVESTGTQMSAITADQLSAANQNSSVLSSLSHVFVFSTSRGSSNEVAITSCPVSRETAGNNSTFVAMPQLAVQYTSLLKS